jgi:hypothetical protein
VGQTQSGHALADYDTVDWFVFDVTRSGSYIIGTTGGLDTVSTLYNSTGDQIGSDDDGGNDYNTRLEVYLDPGTYYVTITQYSSGYGEYSFYVRQ